MCNPQGYTKTDLICKLDRSLYGLKQASRQWNAKFTEFLMKQGLREGVGEICVFVSQNGDIILAIHVDDGLFIFKDMSKAEALIKNLK